MKIIVLGGDGFCGWPTSLRLAACGHEILIIDNLSRRSIDDELSSGSLTNIASINERITAAKKEIGEIEFENIDIANNPLALRKKIAEFKPQAIIHLH